MTDEELGEATMKEARRRWMSSPELHVYSTIDEYVPFLAALLAREGWTPPEPVDPDFLAHKAVREAEQ